MAEYPGREWTEAANCLATVAHQLSSVVHEANNMLQVIAGSAEMIQLNASLPEPVLRRTTIIAEQAHRVSALLGSVRELARYAPSRQDEVSDLAATLAAAIDMRRHALNRAHVALSIEGASQPLMVRASWRPLMQVVLNLLLNAEQGIHGQAGAAIAIALAQHDGTATLTIGDNGSGRPQATQEPFTVWLAPDGSPHLGLGLEASQWLVEREQGRLEVASGSGGGTVATLTLQAA
ncbi:MAG: HAMP domain-containing sensor histidine kinase [Vicinamibacterales bacterium]